MLAGEADAAVAALLLRQLCDIAGSRAVHQALQGSGCGRVRMSTHAPATKTRAPPAPLAS